MFNQSSMFNQLNVESNKSDFQRVLQKTQQQDRSPLKIN
jgi:hypothetical protein